MGEIEVEELVWSTSWLTCSCTSDAGNDLSRHFRRYREGICGSWVVRKGRKETKEERTTREPNISRARFATSPNLEKGNSNSR